MHPSPALLGLVSLAWLAQIVRATTYPRIESWTGTGFWDGFDYPTATYDNTTNGDVFWATADNSSLLYVNDAGRVIMKVDNTTSVVYNDKRYAPKLLSKSSYEPGTVWVLDAVHLPFGCSVWPGFWTQGANWPAGGEIDIMEGVNLQSTNQVALHTDGQGCTASTTSNQTGTLTYANCSTSANENSGCTVNDTTTDSSYGSAFASAGGGVYVAEFAEEAVRVWFFTRSAVPSTLTVSTSTIDTSTLGTPVAEYDSSSCDISSKFGAQTITLDITLCGDWAGTASVLEETCPVLASDATCYTTYVINDQSTTLANAYYEINYLNVFSSNSTGTSTSANGAGDSAGSSSSSSTASSAKSSSTNSAAGRRGWVSNWQIGVRVCWGC